MYLKPCRVCKKEISITSKSCIGCGDNNPFAHYSYRLVFFILVCLLVGYGYYIKSPGITSQEELKKRYAAENIVVEKHKEPTAEEQKIDFTKPIYTKRDALVCPISTVTDKRSDHDLRAALRAWASWNKSENVSKVGCEIWKEGIEIQANPEDKDLAWFRFKSTPNDDFDSLVIFKYSLSN